MRRGQRSVVAGALEPTDRAALGLPDLSPALPRKLVLGDQRQDGGELAPKRDDDILHDRPEALHQRIGERAFQRALLVARHAPDYTKAIQEVKRLTGRMRTREAPTIPVGSLGDFSSLPLSRAVLAREMMMAFVMTF
jgi:hypothetical protein